MFLNPSKFKGLFSGNLAPFSIGEAGGLPGRTPTNPHLLGCFNTGAPPKIFPRRRDTLTPEDGRGLHTLGAALQPTFPRGTKKRRKITSLGRRTIRATVLQESQREGPHFLPLKYSRNKSGLSQRGTEEAALAPRFHSRAQEASPILPRLHQKQNDLPGGRKHLTHWRRQPFYKHLKFTRLYLAGAHRARVRHRPYNAAER